MTMSRRRDSSPTGVSHAGTFYSLYAHGDRTGRFAPRQVHHENLLEIPHRVVEEYAGNPTMALHRHWGLADSGKEFRRWGRRAGHATPSVTMDSQVAHEAHRRGYDGIRYGNYEVQSLHGFRPHPAMEGR